jgi:hypothetical protein
MICGGLCSMGARSDSKSDKGGNGEELWFDGDRLQFAASVDDQVFASSVTAMGSEMAGSDSVFMVFTAVFQKMIRHNA